MAKASFEYDINSRDKTQAGVKSANKGIESVGKTTEKVSKLMKAALAGVSLAAIVKGVKEVNKAFEEQQLVEARLSAAAKNNPLLNNEGVQSLKRFASALQATSTFGDEAIIQQQAFLASMGQSEEQIKATMQAAVDLASTGVISLDSAVKNLAKTNAGMAGELGELIPSLKELTAEELKAGAGIELVAEQYKGMAESMASTNRGIKEQIKNTFGDMLESVGAIFDGIGESMLSKIQPHINALAKWLTDNTDNIIAFFRNLPQIAIESLIFVKDIFFSLFDWEFIKAIGGAIWDYFSASAQSTILTVWTYIKAIGTTIWAPLRYGFEVVVHAIKTAFFTVKDAIAGALNVIIDGLNIALNFAEAKINKLIELQNKLTPGKRLDIGKLNMGEIGRIGTGGAGPGPAPINDVGETITAAWKEMGTQFVDNIKKQWENMKTLGKDMGDAFANNPKFQSALDKLGVKFTELVTPTKKIVENTSESVQATEEGFKYLARDFGGRIDALAKGDVKSGGIGYGGRIGELDPGLPGGTEGNPIISALAGTIASISNAFGPLISLIVEAVSSLSSVMMLMDPLTTIVKGIMQVLGPVINQVLAPLVGILMIFGNVIGQVLKPALDILTPVIEKLTDIFIWLHNEVLKPVGNVIIKIFNGLAEFMAGFINGFIDVINAFLPKDKKISAVTWGDVGAGLITDITKDDVTSSGIAAIGSDGFSVGTTGGGASYTAGRTINQTVNIYTDVVTEGGVRALALMIRDEISAAERLGA